MRKCDVPSGDEPIGGAKVACSDAVGKYSCIPSIFSYKYNNISEPKCQELIFGTFFPKRDFTPPENLAVSVHISNSSLSLVRHIFVNLVFHGIVI